MASDAHNSMTVSYGSFSVTLSGYNQPFDLLKKVTDYYCDVAKNNPEFGAKPSRSNLSAKPKPVPSPVPAEQPAEQQAPEIKAETAKAAFVSSPEETDNLWEKPAPVETQKPLVLDVPAEPEKTPAEPEKSGDLALIHAAGMPLQAPELEPEEPPKAPETPSAKSGFLSNNYPFRHFPLRKPTTRS